VLYPGLEILQAGGVSVGRGTRRPFEVLGAPWIHGEQLADYLNRRAIPGVQFAPEKFTPDSDSYKGQPCDGVSVKLTNRAALQTMRMGIEIASALAKLYPRNFDTAKMIALVGNAATIKQLSDGDEPAAIADRWNAGIENFRKIRVKYLLYP